MTRRTEISEDTAVVAHIDNSEPNSTNASVEVGHIWRSSNNFVQLLSGRWTLLLLSELASAGRRYQDLYEALDGISYKVLTESLRRSERDGLIARHLDGERIETATLYKLTELGRSLEVPLAATAPWAQQNWQEVEAARVRWDRLRRANGRGAG